MTKERAAVSFPPLIIPIQAEVDLFKARRASRELARDLGFSSRDYAAVEIAVSELAANIIKHAGEGLITVESIENGLEIVAADKGPGFADPEAAFRPRGGPAKRSSLGIGLAGVKRLMDELEVSSEPGRGARIVARKWLKKPRRLLRPRQDFQVPAGGLLEYGVISTPRYGAEFNGDAFVIKEYGHEALIAVIDGLGHGEAAYLPAQKAAGYVQENCRQALTAIIEGCHLLLRRTRGVVMSLVRVNLEEAALTWAGVGNIGGKIMGEHPARLLAASGIIGHNIGRPREERFPFQAGDMLFVYSDGVSDRFDFSGRELRGKSARETAGLIVREFGRDEDDVTIVVARGRR